MKAMLSSVLATTIFISSFATLAADRRSVNEIMAANFDSDLPAHEVIAKTVLDLKSEGSSTSEINAFLSHELTPTQLKRVQLAQSSDLSSNEIASMISDLSKGSQFLGASCNSNQPIIWGGVIAAALLYSAAHSASRKSKGNAEDVKAIQLNIQNLEGQIEILKADGLQEGSSFIIAGYRADINTYKLEAKQKEQASADADKKAAPLYVGTAIALGVAGIAGTPCLNF